MNYKFSKIAKLISIFVIGCNASWTVTAQTKQIDSLLTVLSKTKSDTAKIPTLRALSIAFTPIDVDKKFYFANQYRIIAEKNNIDSLIPMAYLDMGMKYGIKSEYDSAMYFFTKGLKIAKQNKFQSQMARAYVSIGYTFDRLDNPKAAIENYKRALQIFKKLNHKKGLNQAYVNLGSLYYDTKEYKIADTYFRQALKIAKESDNESAIAQGYFNIGGTSFKMGDDKNAYDYYSKSLAIRKKANDLNGIALANWGLGELYSKQGKFKEAQSSLNIALKNNQITQNKYQETAVLITISRNYLKQKDYENAELFAKNAFSSAKLIKSKGIEIMTLELLTEIYELKKNYQKAFEYQSQSIILADSLNIEKAKNEFIFVDFERIRSENSSLENTNEVILSTNLTYKKAIIIITSLFLIVVILLFLYLNKIRQKNRVNLILEQQKGEISSINATLKNVIEELRVQNDLTTAQNVTLERINSVKNKFFSIVSHDLRSPIATLKMLLSTYFSGLLTHEEMNSLLKKLEETIFNTADFLDNLLEWSKSQLEGMIISPEVFRIETLIASNLQILLPQIQAKKLVIENNVTEEAIAFADKNMINVVFRNVLSNSIKFCREGDTITIDVAIKEKSVLIAVMDTGVGIADEEQKKIFQLEHTISQGTSGEKGHHIGLVLCKDFLEQNHSAIWFESTLGTGTTFFIEMPIQEK